MATAILNNRMQSAEYARNSWHVTPATGDKPDELLDPKYWVHVCKSLKACDRIEVLSEDRTWYGEAIVLDAGTWGAKVAWSVGPVPLVNSATVESVEDFEVKWAGPSARYRVIRKADGRVLKEQCQTQEEATTWIKSHRKAMAA